MTRSLQIALLVLVDVLHGAELFPLLANLVAASKTVALIGQPPDEVLVVIGAQHRRSGADPHVHARLIAAVMLSGILQRLLDIHGVHGPRGLSELVSRSEAEDYDLVSLMVRLHCRSPSEIFLIPAFVFFFFKLYPPRWVADPARRIAGAAGGCMLIRAATLDRIGGIDSIRGEIIDDCALARRVKAQGHLWLGLAHDTRSIRPYGSWRPIWKPARRA